MHLPGGKKPRLVNPQHLSRGNGLEQFISLEPLEGLSLGEPWDFAYLCWANPDLGDELIRLARDGPGLRSAAERKH